jgi:UDP-N-acetylglucosamine 2-epimerase (non-hydrolysing)
MRVNRQMQPLSPAVTEGAVIRSPLRPRIMVVIGTRPEAIKLCPVVTALRTLGLRTSICATGQHREMAQQVFEIFRLCPDFVLNVLTPDQTLSALSSRLIGQFGQLLEQTRPSILLVQGDTTTTLCAAMVGFYHRIPIVRLKRTFSRGNEPQADQSDCHFTLRGD